MVKICRKYSFQFGQFNRVLNKWQYGVSLFPDYARCQGNRVRIWCFKLKKLPPEDALMIRGIDYTGFIVSFGFLINFSLYK